ncbi:MAG: hypothetical protein HOO06_05020 [Bdellovibrionaceae bacterium]|nr:hypothetical protein [Pseudobdellovibrionaceae bacterium]
MEKKQTENRISFELSMKFCMRDYRFRLSSTKGWIVAIVLILIRIIMIMARDGP